MTKKYLLLLTLILTSCNSSPNWFGAKEKAKIPGERISVLKLENDLVVDQKVASLTITLPGVENSNNWPNSNNSQYILPENIELTTLPKSFKEYKIFDEVANKDIAYFATPIIANEKIYFLNSFGEVKSYSINDKKKPLWTQMLAEKGKRGRNIGGGLQIANNILFITYGQNDVVALDAETGKELWRQHLSNIIRTTPVIFDKILFVKTVDNKLYTLNADNGSIYWLHEGAFEAIGNLAFSSVAIKDGIVVVPYSSGFLYGLNLANGQELWTDNLFYDQFNPINFTITDIDFTPVIKDQVALSASSNGSLFAIDLKTGGLFWQKDVSGVRGFWVAGDFTYLINADNDLITIYNKNGAIKWLKKLDTLLETNKKGSIAKYSGPVIIDNKLVLVSSLGKLLFISSQDGSLISEVVIPKDITLPPVVVGGKIYLFSNNGKLVELE